MTEPREIELRDKSWIDKLTAEENSQSADYSFCNIYIWDKSFKQKVSRVGDRLIVMYEYLSPHFFCYPVGSGDLQPAIDVMADLAKGMGHKLVIRGVTAKHKDELEQHCPGRFTYEEDRPYFDYIYTAEKMSTLSGRKLHGKRNHIHRFIGEHPNWVFEPVTAAVIPELQEMLRKWVPGDDGYETIAAEDEAISRAFENYDALNLEGGLLRVDGSPVAFAVGEMLCSDTYIVHFEKALDIQGAYPMIAREYAKYALELHPDIRWFNREDDMGHENLRRAKQSYYPEYLLEKYIATDS